MPSAVTRHLLDDTHHQPSADRVHYHPSGWRKTIFAVLLLLLAPFTASIPVMIYQRVAADVWIDTWGLLILGAGLFAIMALVLFELIYSLRAEVLLGDNAVRVTVPSGAVGLFPTLFYRTEQIPYDDIARIERIGELHGSPVAPVLLNVTRVVTKDGQLIVLGCCNEQNPDHTFPFDRIADQLAERTGLTVTDLGHVRQKRTLGLLSAGADLAEPEQLAETDIARINSHHNRFIVVASVLLAALLGLGITSDVMTTSAERGELEVNAATR